MRRSIEPTQVVLFATEAGLVAKDTDFADTIPAGKIGVFSVDTNLALDATDAPTNFFISMGIRGDDSVEAGGPFGIDADLLRPSGAVLQCYQDAVSAVVGVKFDENTRVYCGKDYNLRVKLDSDRVRSFLGYYGINETFSVTLNCCDPGCDPADCKETELVDLIKEFIAQINVEANTDFEAMAYDPLTGNVITDLDAFWATPANVDSTSGTTRLAAGIELGIMIQANDSEFKERYGEYDYDWNCFSAQEISVYLVEGFDCGVGTSEVITDVQYDQGTSKQAAMEEFNAMGNLQTPYRYNNNSPHTTPYARDARSEQRVINGEIYDRIDIHFENRTSLTASIVDNSLLATIFVPCSSKVAITTPLLAVLNAQLGTSLSVDGCPSCDPIEPAFLEEAEAPEALTEDSTEDETINSTPELPSEEV